MQKIVNRETRLYRETEAAHQIKEAKEATDVDTTNMIPFVAGSIEANTITATNTNTDTNTNTNTKRNIAAN